MSDNLGKILSDYNPSSGLVSEAGLSAILSQLVPIEAAKPIVVPQEERTFGEGRKQKDEEEAEGIDLDIEITLYSWIYGSVSTTIEQIPIPISIPEFIGETGTRPSPGSTDRDADGAHSHEPPTVDRNTTAYAGIENVVHPIYDDGIAYNPGDTPSSWDLGHSHTLTFPTSDDGEHKHAIVIPAWKPEEPITVDIPMTSVMLPGLYPAGSYVIIIRGGIVHSKQPIGTVVKTKSGNQPQKIKFGVIATDSLYSSFATNTAENSHNALLL